MDTLIDNDVLLKAVCYGFLRELIATVTLVEQVGVLGAAWFVISKKISKAQLKKDCEGVLRDLREFLDGVETVEPTEAEQSMAAEFELAAQRLAVNLDPGESQLCAVLICRTLRFLITGDKRAIIAINRLIPGGRRLDYLSGRVWCVEQLVLIMLSEGKAANLRKAICDEPSVDITLAICFSCTSGSADEEGVKAGLESYVKDLRSKAPKVLAA
jgi:hypothetical protein